MHKFSKYLFIALFFLISANAQAGAFFGVGGSLMSYEEPGLKVEPINALLRGGYAFNDYVELGGEFNFTLLPDSEIGADWDVDTTFLFLKLNLPLGDTARAYVMVGPTDVEVSATVGFFQIIADDTDTGTGFGIQFDNAAGATWALDYITYFDDLGAEISSFNISFIGYF